MPAFRILASLTGIVAADWDGLHDGRNPFVAHAFLSGLEQHGCLRPDFGWTPQHLTLWDGDTLAAAAPGYLKTNSHGEFVFDHAWAHAYARHGLDYFPKWLCAVPYSPVTGPRLLANDAESRQDLVQAIVAMTRTAGLSSAHVNFHPETEAAAFGDDWLPRIDVQYHWRNLPSASMPSASMPSPRMPDQGGAGWRTFDDYLAAMDHRHRKNIRQERARVRRSGVAFRTVHGDEASDADLATMHRFYLRTFADYGNLPALTLEFLRHLAREMPRQLVLVLAECDGAAIAGSLSLRGKDTLYGRYWGTSPEIDQVTLPGLHFETCYYQGIDYCLREGLHVFEPGAQGEHKLARGFLPTLVHSRHWIADPAFARALGAWCREETDSVQRHAAVLATHGPFRKGL